MRLCVNIYIYACVYICVCAKSPRLCPTFCDPMDCSLPGFSVHRTLQARILEWSPCPPTGDLSDPGIKPMTLMSPALAGWFCTTSATWEAQVAYMCISGV